MLPHLALVYEKLLEHFGPQGWWPLFKKGGKGSPPTPLYHQGAPETESEIFEMAMGAILTQNTTWTNAACALYELNKRNLMEPKQILALDLGVLEEYIRRAGYYRQKAKKLKALARFFQDQLPAVQNAPLDKLRRAVLEVFGVGPETADSILLYGLGHPTFVIDAYTLRILERVGYGGHSYYSAKALLEKQIPPNTEVYKEFHALFVELAKQYCTKNAPKCPECPLQQLCQTGGAK